MANNIPDVPDYVDEQDYEYILASYLGNVRDDVDKREGSIIWDAGAPCCIEIAKAYLYLQAMILNVFASTAQSPFLEYRCAEQGIDREPATYAKRLGIFTDSTGQPYSLTIGTEFSTVSETNLVNFKIISVYTQDNQTIPGSYILQCTEAGTIGNEYFGEIVPIINLSGLATATLTDILVPGEAEQDIEDLRHKYLDRVKQKPFGGNITEYRQYVESIEGVSICQIYPTWNGGGTVKIAFIDSSFNVPSSTLISNVQQAVDPHYNDEYAGMGLGMAPIGHVVTIVGATSLEINVNADVEYKTGYSSQAVNPNIKTNLENYFLELRKEWDQADNLNNYSLKVIMVRVISVILNTSGVENVISCKMNNETNDIVLTETKTLQQVPVIGDVTING